MTLVARFTNNPTGDIERGWSGYMGMGFKTPQEAVDWFWTGDDDIEPAEMTDEEAIDWLADYNNTDLRLDAQCGLWRSCHHDGLSCWSLESTTDTGAIIEARLMSQSGEIGWGDFGWATVGSVRLVAHVCGDLYIFECDDIKGES